MHFSGKGNYKKQKIIVISWVTVSDMYKTMVLFSYMFDFSIFQIFALRSFLHSGIYLTKELAHNFVKFPRTSLISLYSASFNINYK